MWQFILLISPYIYVFICHRIKTESLRKTLLFLYSKDIYEMLFLNIKKYLELGRLGR